MSKASLKYNEKKMVSLLNSLGQSISIWGVEKYLDLLSHTIHKKIDSKWFSDLNVEGKAMKYLKENGTLCSLEVDNDFLSRISYTNNDRKYWKI